MLWQESGCCGRSQGVVAGVRVLWQESGCCGRSQGVVVGVVALAPAKSLWHTICQFA